jgi:hypothetical protein
MNCVVDGTRHERHANDEVPQIEPRERRKVSREEGPQISQINADEEAGNGPVRKSLRFGVPGLRGFGRLKTGLRAKVSYFQKICANLR